jgi:hypothetical protein
MATHSDTPFLGTANLTTEDYGLLARRQCATSKKSTRNNIPEYSNPQYHRRNDPEVIHQYSYHMTVHNHIPNATNAIKRALLVQFFITYPPFMPFAICYLYYLKNIVLGFKQERR